MVLYVGFISTKTTMTALVVLVLKVSKDSDTWSPFHNLHLIQLLSDLKLPVPNRVFICFLYRLNCLFILMDALISSGVYQIVRIFTSDIWVTSFCETWNGHTHKKNQNQSVVECNIYSRYTCKEMSLIYSSLSIVAPRVFELWRCIYLKSLKILWNQRAE